MQKLHILVEGQTEEVIVNNVIGPYLSSEDLYITTSILKTKQQAGGHPHTQVALLAGRRSSGR